MSFFTTCRSTEREKYFVNKLIDASAANHYNSDRPGTNCVHATVQSKILEVQDWKINVPNKIFLSLFNPENSWLAHACLLPCWQRILLDTTLSQLNPNPVLTTCFLKRVSHLVSSDTFWPKFYISFSSLLHVPHALPNSPFMI
jgi:hypothetical protein